MASKEVNLPGQVPTSELHRSRGRDFGRGKRRASFEEPYGYLVEYQERHLHLSEEAKVAYLSELSNVDDEIIAKYVTGRNLGLEATQDGLQSIDRALAYYVGKVLLYDHFDEHYFNPPHMVKEFMIEQRDLEQFWKTF